MTEQRTNLIKQAAARSSDYQRGVEDGRRMALAELQPQVEKMASAAVGALRQDDVDREVLRGQVTAQSAASYLSRSKASMKLGLCWKCGDSAPSPTSTYMLCNTCTH